MKSLIKALLVLGLVGVFIIGLAQLKSNTYSQNPLIFCCNNLFPPYSKPPTDPTGMKCTPGEPDEITNCLTCARYWSAYGSNPTEMCKYLPGEPPLPPIPVPSNFDVTETYDHHPKVTWNRYWVHWYDIYRKIDSGSWQRVQRITNRDTESWIDTDIDLTQPGHIYYYKMRGSVYDAYSNFTAVKSIHTALSATMSGPSYLEPYEVGTFTAHPSGGYPPYDYTWYRMELCGPEPISGGVQPLRPPCNVWVHLSQFDGSQTATSSGISPGFKMRVDVEDDDGNTVSVEKTVSVGGGLQKPLAQEDIDREALTTYALFPNYPNPFNPETTIRYQLAEESWVSLSVYNLLGEEVKRLVDENQPAGAHSIRWDGRDSYGKQVAGGIYVTKIETVGSSGRFVQSRKMILIK